MSIHKLPHGKWCFRKRVELPDGTIKNVQRTYATKKEAQLQEQLFKVSNDEVELNKLTFNDVYLHFVEYKKNKMQQSSIYNMEKLFAVHIDPFFKNKKIKAIASRDIINWQNEMAKSDYSLKYKRDMYTYLNALFEHAKNHFELERNPMDKVDNFQKIRKDSKKIEFWTYDDYLKFIKVVHDKTYNILFELLFYSGARRGEILALTWNDINWQTNEIEVSKTIKPTRGMGTQYIGEPKTDNAHRKIVLPDSLIKKLTEYHMQQKNIDGFSNDSFVCGTSDFLKNTTIERKKNYYCKLANVKQIRIHDFRHSHAALLINQGVSMYVLSKRLGHSRIEITANIYGHLYPSVQAQIKDTLNNLKTD